MDRQYKIALGISAALVVGFFGWKAVTKTIMDHAAKSKLIINKDEKITENQPHDIWGEKIQKLREKGCLGFLDESVQNKPECKGE